MSLQLSATNGRSKLRRPAIALFALLILAGAAFGYLAYSANTVGHANTSGGTNVSSGVKVAFSVSIHKQEQSANIVWLTQMALKGQFWQASCYAFCSNGITYTLDPVPFITNEGNDFLQCKIFDVASVLTCSTASSEYGSAMGLSTSSTAMATGDTAAGATDACGSTLIATTDGLGVAAGTPTAGSLGSSGTTQNTITVTVAHTFTDATGSTSAVQDACLLTGTSGTVYLLAEGNFGPDTLAVGNTVTITWTMSVS